MPKHAHRTRPKTAPVLALLSAVLVTAAFGVGAQPASADDVHDCALIWDWGLPPGTFSIKAVNRKSPASDGTYVNVDHLHSND